LALEAGQLLSIVGSQRYVFRTLEKAGTPALLARNAVTVELEEQFAYVELGIGCSWQKFQNKLMSIATTHTIPFFLNVNIISCVDCLEFDSIHVELESTSR
jgi:hypothetical protein